MSNSNQSLCGINKQSGTLKSIKLYSKRTLLHFKGHLTIMEKKVIGVVNAFSSPKKHSVQSNVKEIMNKRRHNTLLHGEVKPSSSKSNPS